MEIKIKKFHELAAAELYGILALRTDIFVVEQECAYRELDFHDQKSHHVIGTVGSDLVAYARILPAETVYEMPSIGRFAVPVEKRRRGYGRTLFEAALKEARQLYLGESIKIQAQCYLEDFYKSLGFKTVSAPYPDYDIMHVDMVYSS